MQNLDILLASYKLQTLNLLLTHMFKGLNVI